LDSNQICVDANNKRLIVAPKINRVLEKMVLRLDGTSVESQSGTITTTDTNSVTLTTSYLTVGSVSYVPPTGTKQVLIRFSTSYRAYATNDSPMFQCIFNVDNKEVTSSLMKHKFYLSGGYANLQLVREMTITIDPDAPATNTFADGRITSWTAAEAIFFTCKRTDTPNVSMNNNDGSVYKPTFTITAIGEGY
jgi:hypothetical protein